MKIVSNLIRITIVLTVLLGCGFIWVIYSQGPSDSLWKSYSVAKISFDDLGVPLIEADSWDRAIEAQGFVEASQRLFQMDLIRRKVLGRLSELFGEKALKVDLTTIKQGIPGIIQDASQKLSPENRRYCDLYAKGVNEYIKQNSNRWSLEYVFLRTTPDKWSCADSLSVGFSLADSLSSNFANEIGNKAFFEHLPAPWIQFLFPANHPWAKPIFGTNTTSKALIEKYPLNKSAIAENELTLISKKKEEIPTLGSNSWIYQDQSGNAFLANDPHLQQTVPGIWLPLRIRISSDQWVVGVSAPGLYGVTIGANPHVAWGFTNTGTDVDDLYSEKVDLNSMKYVEKTVDGLEYWENIEKTTVTYKVYEQAHTIDIFNTSRGPLLELPNGSGKYYSRVWVAANAERLSSLDIIKINRSNSVEEIRENFKTLKFIAQNAIFSDYSGNSGLVVTGTHYRRTVSGLTPQPGEFFHKIKPQELFQQSYELKPSKHSDSFGLAMANQTLWVDPYGNYWSDEDRASRIRELLNDPKLDQKQMENMQLDDYSRFYKELINWIASNQTLYQETSTAPLIKDMTTWDGHLSSNEKLFHIATKIETSLRSFIIKRLKDNFIPHQIHKKVFYRLKLRRSPLVTAMNRTDFFELLGTSASEVSNKLIKEANQLYPDISSYSHGNTWSAQHPFVKSIPVLGKLFKVKPWEQKGHFGLLNVDSNGHGASVRLVWNLTSPEESTWVFPVGTSGHINSVHYKDSQPRWIKDQRQKVFNPEQEWIFFGSKIGIKRQISF